MKFYDRDREIKELNSLPPGFNLVVLYGRRRIGKTRLVNEFLKGKKSAYVFVPKGIGTGRFLEEISIYLKIPRFRSVFDMISYVLERFDHVFIDEFQNLPDIEPEVISLLQREVDRLDHGNVEKTLIIAGSSHSMMRKIFLEDGRPLFGRARRTIPLGKLPINACLEMLEDRKITDPVQKIRYYSVFGGVPKYYLDINDGEEFDRCMERLFLTSSSPLRREGDLVIKSELGGEYRTYLSVLEAICSGHHDLGEIGSALAAPSPTVSKYIKILRDDFNLVRREVPVTEDPGRYKKSRYVVDDNLLRFWYTFVKSMEPYFEQGMDKEIIRRFRGRFHNHESSIFEEICIKIVNRMGYLASRWWKGEEEIDIVGLDHEKEEILFGEVKWRNRKMNLRDLEDLKRKSSLVGKFDRYSRKYLLVSSGGFSDSLRKREGRDLILWDLEDVFDRITALAI